MLQYICIFLLCLYNVSEKDKGIETPDERIYRKAFNKKLNI